MSGYLLDSNIFIQPHRLYYPFDLAPSFWRRLAEVLKMNDVLIIDKVSDEILFSEDELSDWFKKWRRFTNIFFVENDGEICKNYALIINYIRNCGFYKITALKSWSEAIADPWLIAVAMSNGYKIVTDEQSAGKNFSKKHPHGKVKIPDIAEHFKVQCITLFDFMRIKHFVL